MRRLLLRACVIAVTTIVALAAARRADAQIGSLVSPGALSRAHASLEGVAQCQQCHERGRQVAADRCLTCHKPIADRILRKVGVHKDVKTDCVQCHVEHAGRDGELRPFDQAAFKHAAVTGFALDGVHAASAQKCAACHTGRTFLNAKPTCSSCHADAHKGQLGTTCQRCHSTAVPFKSARASFDHGSTKFPLTGAHRTAACQSCHVAPAGGGAPVFAGLKFSSCESCHKSPHPAQMTANGCTSCHTTTTWSTKKFDHSATSFPLVGKHAAVACSSCHKGSTARTKPAAATCATCHADPHKGEFRQDCRACHDESGFSGARFDHASTRFALRDAHAAAKCEACHTTIHRGVPAAKAMVDFRGPQTACASCHADPHRAAFGGTCESCHSTGTFHLTDFKHPGDQELFTGQHASLTCQQCHAPAPLPATAGAAPKVALGAASFKETPTTCSGCHRDVHLGQVGTDCSRCHSLKAVKFAPDRFAHTAASFQLTGAHASLACAKCHAAATGAFPAGTGTATRLKGIASTCASCHRDIHLGQLRESCDTCHTTSSFVVSSYEHKNGPKDFFVGPHLSPACAACHKITTGQFPAGSGTAIKFKVGSACVACHVDIHRGAMGPNCRDCHKLVKKLVAP